MIRFRPTARGWDNLIRASRWMRTEPDRLLARILHVVCRDDLFRAVIDE